MKFMEIRENGITYFGGDQSWFSSRRKRSMGCGIIGASHVIWQIENRPGRIIKSEYMKLADMLGSRYIHVLPKLGINGVFLAAGINVYFKMHHLPYWAAWGAFPGNIWKRTQEMLDREIPVVLAIGPNFPNVRGKRRLCLYRKSGEKYLAAADTAAHYVTVTDMDEQWLTVSSWGRKYYISKDEYLTYAKEASNFLFSNILVVRPRGNQ